MSGRKTTYTTIPESELRDLRTRAQRAASLQASNRLLNELSEKNEAALTAQRQRVEALNSRIASLNRALGEQRSAASKEAEALRGQLRAAVDEMNLRNQQEASRAQWELEQLRARLTGDLRRTREELDRSVAENRAYTDRAVAESSRVIAEAMRRSEEALRGEIRGMGERIDGELNDIRSRMDAVEESVQSAGRNRGALLEMANEYLNTANLVAQHTRESFRVDLLCPGRLQPVLDRLESARRELVDAQKMPENAAVARREARQAFEEAVRLNREAAAAEQEWSLHYHAARETADAVSAQLEASATLRLAEDNAAVDVDRWTDGDLTALRARLDGIDGELAGAQALTVEALDGLRAAGLQISREIDDASVFAAEAFYASQDRGEIAQDAADQLAAFGLTLLGHSYQGGDQRGAHRMHLRNNGTRFELVITQTPELLEDGSITNRIESDILNYGSLNEERGDEIAREVLSSLAGLGFRQQPVCTAEGYEHAPSDRTECADLQRWRSMRGPVVKPDHAARGAAHPSAPVQPQTRQS